MYDKERFVSCDTRRSVYRNVDRASGKATFLKKQMTSAATEIIRLKQKTR